MRYRPTDHTFAICAYKSSPYLEECIKSLKAQSVQSSIIICTSTPNNHINKLASKYAISVYVDEKSEGIASDWNYCLKICKTKLITIVHQDDIYERDFLKYTLAELNRGGKSIIAFTSYYEIQNRQIATSKNFINLKIKDLMLRPLTLKSLQHSQTARRMILSLADPICCPSVTYVRKNIPVTLFDNSFKVVLDWRAWELLSRRNGRFAYVAKPLVGHRMYSGSTTMRMIKNHTRTQEDLKIYRLFWPEPIAELLGSTYSLSQLCRKKIMK